MAEAVESRGRTRGVRSVAVAMRVLEALAANRGPMTLGGLAATLGMPAAKVHRYAVSLIEAGMMVQRSSGSYDLGKAAARVGLAAVTRVDPVNAAAGALPDLVERTGCPALLSVWGSQGPTVIRWEQAPMPLITMLGLGSVLSVTRSATGHVFMAHLPDRLLAPAIAVEAPGKTVADFAELRAGVRETGFAVAEQDFIPGLYAIARAVLDLQGRAAAVVTLISADAALLEEQGRAWRALAAFGEIGEPEG